MASLETTVVLLAVIFILGAMLRRAHADLYAIIPHLTALQKQVTILQQAQTKSEDEEGKMKSVINELGDMLELTQEAHVSIIDGARCSDEDLDALRAKMNLFDGHQVAATTRIDAITEELATFKTQIDRSQEIDKQDKLTLIDSISAMVSRVEDIVLDTHETTSATPANGLAQFGLESKRKSISNRTGTGRMSSTSSLGDRSFMGLDVSGRISHAFGDSEAEKERAGRKRELQGRLHPVMKINERKDSGYGEDYSELEETIMASRNGFNFEDERSGYGGSVVGLKSGKEGRRFSKMFAKDSFM